MDIKKRIEDLKTTVKACPYREVLLAYAFLRGRAYRRIELRTREHNEPFAGSIYDVLNNTRTEWWRLKPEQRDALLADIKAWLSTPATPEMLEDYESKRREYIARKKQHALEMRAKYTKVA